MFPALAHCVDKQVFNRSELQAIADLCIKHDTLCFSDEVYEWIIYKGHEHVKIGTPAFQLNFHSTLKELGSSAVSILKKHMNRENNRK